MKSYKQSISVKITEKLTPIGENEVESSDVLQVKHSTGWVDQVRFAHTDNLNNCQSIALKHLYL